ncbi:MAG: ABC transporter ATP-binding protein [Christensenellaceae bacterium]|jgi:putative ABC transport system ATP-binding protein|nr:ABC transporter ATP-binding protein [Christensenellaceae bacterium]
MPNPLLKLTQIVKSYKGRTILDKIDLGIYSADFVSIMGVSGAGKSTLLNILALFEKQDAGLYYINGSVIPTREFDICRIRNNTFGFIFQSYNLLSGLTTAQNIALPLQYSDEKHQQEGLKRTKELIERLDMKHIENERVDNLSGGEKQRVAIARALVNNPQVIFADEPTGNLDAVSRNTVLSLLKGLNHSMGVAIVMVTHDPVVADFTARKLQIVEGKLGDRQ